MHTVCQILAADYLQKKELIFIQDFTELAPVWSFELSSEVSLPHPRLMSQLTTMTAAAVWV